MIGNVLLVIGLLCLTLACAVPENRHQPAGGILYRVAALISSAKVFVAIPLIGVMFGVLMNQALAQDTRPVGGTILLTSPSWKLALADFMMQLVQISSPILLAWFSWKLNQWFGLKQEAEKRDAFQTALTNAAGKMIAAASSAGKIALIGATERNRALADGLKYLQESAPDAIAFFKLTQDDLIKKLEAKVGLLIADQMGSARK